MNDDLLRLCATLALAGTVGCAPLAWHELRALARGLSAQDRRWLLLLAALAAALLALMPGRMVQIFTGYGLLDDVAMARGVPRYGAGQGAVLGPLFDVFGVSEGLVFALNGALGWLAMGLAALLCAAWTGRPRAALWSALALLLVPLLARHHRSEAAAVLAMPALLLGLLHGLRAHRAGGLPRDAAAAALSWAFAAHVRPELAIAGPVLFAAQWWVERRGPSGAQAQGPLAPGRALRSRRLLACLPALLVVPQWLHLLAGLHAESGAGDLPMANSAIWLKLPLMLFSHNLAFWPHAFPLGLTALACWALWRQWRGAAQVSALARWLPLAYIALLAPSLLDPPIVSLPRLQAPPLLLLVAVGAALAEATWPRPNRWLAMTAAAVIAGSAAATAPWHARADNSQHEAALFDAAAADLQGKRGVLHLLLPGDEGHDKVSRHQPLYRFRRPHAALRFERLADVPGPADVHRGLGPGEARYVLLGVRCYARERARASPAPAQGQHEACARLRGRPDAEVVRSMTVTNRGDVHFPWWPSTASFELVLQRYSTAP